ncbi:MAG: HAMP domain-containing histidine kinase [Oscillospiraceae bacterium]|nr:HAMP domain-containing histidine kinase [Oscillospiraceae bacterium]
MEEISEKDRLEHPQYPIPSDSFKQVGRYVPSYLPIGPLPLPENIYVSDQNQKKQKRTVISELFIKIKGFIQNTSLKTAFSLYVISYIFVSLLISAFIVILLFLTRDIFVTDSIINLITLASPIIVGAILLLSILIAGLQFYRKRIQPPLELLENASQRIATENLDFSLSYPRDDEMGKLCESFEAMRATLEETHAELTRQVEERKRLNSVFSHDLRTPLTVLKGNIHLLKEYLLASNISDNMIADSLEAMNNHVIRLENYVEIMSRLQKLEDIEISPVSINSREFSEQLRSTAEIMCETHTIRFFDDIAPSSIIVDPEIILTVAENLISNAARYARRVISVVCSYSNSMFILSVSDDGDGFSDEDLLLGVNPFYKASRNVFDTHFGLGLNICKTLAVKHGGGIFLENISAGGALVRVEFAEYI